MSAERLGGLKLGSYSLQTRLGAGGMGVVYRAIQTNLEREVAVKVLVLSAESPREASERFTREAKTAAQLEHPNIVPIYDYGIETIDGTPYSYVAMRLLTGGTLSERLRERLEHNQPLPSPGEVSHLLHQLANALDYAHARGVIHRDIKPSNVMFDHQNTAYLLDFGIAKLIGMSSGLTATGAAMGTPIYMPPEQWRAESITPAADQYALAGLIYTALTGAPPFEADTPFALMHKHLYDAPTPPQVRRSDLPSGIARVLAQAMMKDPSERFATVLDFAETFESAIEGQRGTATGVIMRRSSPKVPASLGEPTTPAALMPDMPTITPPQLSAVEPALIESPTYSTAPTPPASATSIIENNIELERGLVVDDAAVAPEADPKAQVIPLPLVEKPISPISSPAAPRPRRLPLRLIAGVVGLVIVGGAAAFGLASFNRPTPTPTNPLIAAGATATPSATLTPTRTRTSVPPTSAVLPTLDATANGRPGSAFFNAGITAHQSDNYQQAVEQYLAALDAGYDHANLYFNLGLAYYDLATYDEAVEYLTLALSPGSQFEPLQQSVEIRALVLRGRAYYQQENYSLAVDDFETVLNMDDAYFDAYYWLGEVYQEQGDHETALEYYSQAVAIDPTDRSVYLQRGFSYYTLDQFELAFEDYDQAVSVDPDYYLSYYNRGAMHYHFGRYQQAINDASEAIRLNPNYPRAYSLRGDAYYYLGTYAPAYPDYATYSVIASSTSISFATRRAYVEDWLTATPSSGPTRAAQRATINTQDGGRVNLRSGAGQTFPVLTTLEDGVSVEILEYSGSWARVRVIASGYEGWVSTALLNR